MTEQTEGSISTYMLATQGDLQKALTEIRKNNNVSLACAAPAAIINVEDQGLQRLQILLKLYGPGFASIPKEKFSYKKLVEMPDRQFGYITQAADPCYKGYGEHKDWVLEMKKRFRCSP